MSPKHAALAEVDLVESPVVSGVVQRAAADGARVYQRVAHLRHFRRLRRVAAKGLRALAHVGGDARHEPVFEFVVLEIRRREARTLFEHHHRQIRRATVRAPGRRRRRPNPTITKSTLSELR